TSKITTLLSAARETEAPPVCRPVFGPCKAIRSGLEYRTNPSIFQILQAKCERLDLQRSRKLVHVRLAGEVICSSGQASVGSLSKGRFHGMKVNALIRDFVGSFDA